MPDGAQHVAFAYSADGKDRFTTVYPNLNLLDGTRDFSGNWLNSNAWYKSGSWYESGTHEGLTVMSFKGGWNGGLSKSFTVPSDGIYSMSMLAKVKDGSTGQFAIESTGKPAILKNISDTGGKFITQSYTGTFTKGQNVLMYLRFSNDKDITKDGLSVAGHKIEQGSTATPWMPSFSEVTVEDYPSYIGTYTDNDSNTQSTDPEKYIWKKID